MTEEYWQKHYLKTLTDSVQSVIKNLTVESKKEKSLLSTK